MRDNNRDKDNAVRRILGIDPGVLKTGLAIFEMDEDGKLVLDSLKVYQAANHQKSNPFGFTLDSILSGSSVVVTTANTPQARPLELLMPPGFPFWDMLTTLILTDFRVKVKLQYLFARQFAKIPHNKTGFEWMERDAGRYEAFCRRGMTPFTHPCEMVELPLAHVFAYEPSAAEKEITERYLVPNLLPEPPRIDPYHKEWPEDW